MVAEAVISAGGTALLTEVPEMFGAEQELLNRCVNRAIFDRAAAMIQGYKDYFVRHGQPVYENPSPGNREGGITTLEEKSLGCTQKGGRAPVSQVIHMGRRLKDLVGHCRWAGQRSVRRYHFGLCRRAACAFYYGPGDAAVWTHAYAKDRDAQRTGPVQTCMDRF